MTRWGSTSRPKSTEVDLRTRSVALARIARGRESAWLAGRPCAGTLVAVHLRAALLVSLLLVPVAEIGCATGPRAALRVPNVPPRVTSLDDFAVALNDYALVPPGHPKREQFRVVLGKFLLEYIDRCIADKQYPEAVTALQYTGALYSASELRKRAAVPELASAARRVYAVSAKRGLEKPSMFALAVEQHFGSERARASALTDWTQLEQWIVRNSMFATEPLLQHEELEQTLEETAAIFPSPFVVERLADLYVARYGAALAGRTRGSEVGLAATHRAEVTGYLLIRLYLRADDFEGSLAALERIQIDTPTRKLREFVIRAKDPARTSGPLLALAAQFQPDEGTATMPPVFATQGWGIVENLGRRAIARHPNDPFAHLLMARSFRQSGLIDAAIVHLEHVIARKEDIFDAWQELAVLHQASLSRISQVDEDAALARLPKLEGFHGRAVKLWRDRPIRPRLSEAYLVVGQALYDTGRVDEAATLLERGLAIEREPETIDLLGTIALKRGRFADAERRYTELVELPLDDKTSRLRWEARAALQLGEISRRQGKAQHATVRLREAMQHMNKLLSVPQLDESLRSETLVDRGRLLFVLGDIALAMEDFRQAAALTPDRAQCYAEPLLSLVSHGYYDQAHEVYVRAMAREDIRESLKLYFTLWMNELALRQGLAPERRVELFLRRYAGTGWESKLALHAQGKLSFQELLGTAGDQGERAEAYFYEGLRRWRTGDARGGQALMRKVLNTDMMGFFEYEMAQQYLELGGPPPKAKPPLSGVGHK